MTDPATRDTWLPRDLPVLTACIQALDSTEKLAWNTESFNIAKAAGLDHDITVVAMRALHDDGLIKAVLSRGSGRQVQAADGRARRLASFWPPDTDLGVQRIVEALEHMAEHATTEEERSAARTLLGVAGTVGQQMLVAMVVKVLTGYLPGGLG